MADYRLNVDGPHSDDYTRHVADAMSEAVRVLNHATYPGPGVTEPSTVYEVLGALRSAASGLPQLLDQLGDVLVQLHASGRLGDDRWDPARALAAARRELASARFLADQLDTCLSGAHNATSGMHMRGGGEN